jgi:hypothetical protein
VAPSASKRISIWRPERGSATDSICSKTRAWGAIVKPDAFRLLAGDGALHDYRFGSKRIHRMFCGHCGVQLFDRGHIPELGGNYVSIRLATLDDASVAELTGCSAGCIAPIW